MKEKVWIVHFDRVGHIESRQPQKWADKAGYGWLAISSDQFRHSHPTRQVVVRKGRVYMGSGIATLLQGTSLMDGKPYWGKHEYWIGNAILREVTEKTIDGWLARTLRPARNARWKGVQRRNSSFCVWLTGLLYELKAAPIEEVTLKDILKQSPSFELHHFATLTVLWQGSKGWRVRQGIHDDSIENHWRFDNFVDAWNQFAECAGLSEEEAK